MSNQNPRENAIFNKNKLKIGTFATNTVGSMHTQAPDAFQPSWANALKAAKVADSAGFEALLALARWRGPLAGNPDHRGHVVLDPFAWGAALAMATSYSTLFSTTHAPMVHPLIVAKQSATIDHISGGRFGLNVVGGWNRPEFEMFGFNLDEHDRRYEYLEEWLTVIKRLWTEHDEINFQGEFLKLKGAISRPQPIQKPYPPIFNAAVSARGQRFAAEHADAAFVYAGLDKDAVASYKTLAREEFGRDLAVWTQIPVVQRSTRDEAEMFLNYFANEHEDVESVDAWVKGINAESRDMKGENAKFNRVDVSCGGPPVVGTAQDVADKLAEVSERGIDGVLLSWFDFDDGLTRFTEEVVPLLEKAGLRDPFTSSAS